MAITRIIIIIIIKKKMPICQLSFYVYFILGLILYPEVMFVFHCARRDCHHNRLNFIPSGIKTKNNTDISKHQNRKKKISMKALWRRPLFNSVFYNLNQEPEYIFPLVWLNRKPGSGISVSVSVNVNDNSVKTVDYNLVLGHGLGHVLGQRLLPSNDSYRKKGKKLK